jgi:hypothetical protein
MATDVAVEAGRCVHELLPGQCAYCRPPAEHPGRRHRERPSRPFPAGYRDECDECGGEIEAGDMIVMWEGSACHEGCAS